MIVSRFCSVRTTLQKHCFFVVARLQLSISERVAGNGKISFILILICYLPVAVKVTAGSDQVQLAHQKTHRSSSIIN